MNGFPSKVTIFEEKKALERTTWIILGRIIGTGTGWDVVDNLSIVIYDFVPIDGLNLPSGDLFVDYENGFIGVDVDAVIDLVDTVKHLPRAP